MLILRDDDGSKLKHWRKLFKDDPEQFAEVAHHWAEHCANFPES